MLVLADYCPDLIWEDFLKGLEFSGLKAMSAYHLHLVTLIFGVIPRQKCFVSH